MEGPKSLPIAFDILQMMESCVREYKNNTWLDLIDSPLSCPNLINEKDAEGYTPLHLAIISGNKTIVEYLLQKGAECNAVDNEQHSLVHWATGRTKNNQ